MWWIIIGLAVTGLVIWKVFRSSQGDREFPSISTSTASSITQIPIDSGLELDSEEKKQGQKERERKETNKCEVEKFHNRWFYSLLAICALIAILTMAIWVALTALNKPAGGAESINLRITFGVGIGLYFAFFVQGALKIPAIPPTGAIPLFWGSLVNVFIEAGWRFFPLRGYLFDYRLMDARLTDLELVDPKDPTKKGIDERTPDNGVVHIEPSFVYRIDRMNPRQFFNAGGKATVERIFSSMVDRALREWIVSPREGPQTWQGARESNGLATDRIMQILFPEYMLPIPEKAQQALPENLRKITIEALMKHFTNRPSLYLNDEAFPKKYNPTAQDEEWQTALETLEKGNATLYGELKKAVDRRIDEAILAKGGSAHYVMENLGIEITLVNIGNIDPVGTTAEAADKVIEAKLDAEAKIITAQLDADTKNIKGTAYRGRIQKMKKIVNGDARLAVDAVTVQEGAVKKEIKETTVGIPQANADVLGTVLSVLVNNLTGRKDKS